MSHSVHPYAHRIGILRDWKSAWFSTKNKYREYLHADLAVRNYIEKNLKGMYVADVVIERNDKMIRVIIQTSRPGLIIGRNGEGVTKLRANLEKLLRKNDGLPEGIELKLDVQEVRNAEANAMIVAQMVAEQLEKRMTFRRVLKTTVEKVMGNHDVKGIRIRLAGRLGGAEMARTEQIKKGQIPLQTFRADIDYAHYEARLPYGAIGIKVWIYRGDVFEKEANVNNK